jgi:hypothetical protein
MASSLLPRPRARALAGLVAACAVALPVAGCASDSSGGGGNAGADPASFLPASAPVYVEAQVQPGGDLKANVDAVAGKILHTGDPAAKIVGLLDKQLAKDGDSYAKDIEPWLGQRAGLAVTGFGTGTGSHADVVAAIASKDDDAAKKFVASRKGASEREYRGVKYEYKSGEDTAAVVLDHAVLVGNERGLKSAIDARSGSTLADNAAFKHARDVVGTEGLGFAYADPSRLFDAIAAQANSASGGKASAQQLNLFKGFLAGSGLKSVAASLDVAKDAVRADVAAIGLKPGAAGGTGSGDGPGAAAAVPAGSWLSVGFGDVGGTFDSMLKNLGSSGAFGGMSPEVLLSGLKSQLGIDVQKDFLAWMGDAALFVRGTTRSDLGGALVVHSKDPAASRRAIPKLKTLLTGLGVHVGSLSGARGASGVSGLSVKPGSSMPGAIEIASKGDMFVVAYGKGALGEALAGGSKLGDSAPYKTAAGLLDGAKPSLFLDTPQVVKLIGAFAGNDPDFQKAKPTLQAFGPAAAGAKHEGDAERVKIAVSVP